MLSEKELRDHFNMPLNEVAKKFSMCTTALKKLCRKYGVMQWPHRKLRSIEKKIASLRAEQVGKVGIKLFLWPQPVSWPALSMQSTRLRENRIQQRE